MQEKTILPENQPGGVSIKAENLSFTYGALSILENASFTLTPRQVTCLVGENGVGKSTLLKILARQLEASSGTITSSKPAYTVEYVPQITPQLPNQEQTAFEFLLETQGLDELFKKLEYFYQNMNDPKVIQEYKQFLEEHDETKLYQARQEIEDVLERFIHLSSSEQEKGISQLSGGQKTRLLLVKSFLSQPDLLLLDEPDNNLDVEALGWLLREIKKFPNTILVIGHKVSFIDQIAQKILEFRQEDHKVYFHTGNYSSYLEIMLQQKDLKEKEQDRILEERKELKKAIQKKLKLAQRSEKGRKQKRDNEKLATHAKIERATQHYQGVARKLKEQLEELPNPEKKKELIFNMKIEPSPSGQNILSLKDLSKRYSTPLFSELNLILSKGEHMVVVGPNASGKSTLLKIIQGEVAPDNGQVNLGSRVIVGYFPQEQEGLPDVTVLEFFKKTVSLPETELKRSLHGHFLFSENEVLRKIKNLSAGKRARVFFAQFALLKANLLLLDEPTNNLDPKAREAVVQMLTDYKGAILVVSHDWEFLEKLRIDKTLVLNKKNTELGGRR